MATDTTAAPVTAGPTPVRRAVANALRHWRMRQKLTAEAAPVKLRYPSLESVLQPIPRRERLIGVDEQSEALLPSFTVRPQRSRLGRSLGRLAAWTNLILTVILGALLDWLLRRDSAPRRAVRLRQALERAGGTFVKFGQQAAMRIDLLPWAYCVELSKMLDKMVPFRTELALAAIERTTGKPWKDTFAIFDPEPIGSASIACVYQAVLKDGRKVAVKVRRPDIMDVFLADFQVLDWLAGAAEFLAIVRPGLTRNLRAELRETLLEELDFRKEARFQDTFRRNAKKSGKDFFTAPSVFFELSGEAVLVQEYVTGVWLWEVIAAVEQTDPRGRDLLRQRHIDPQVVARRILWAAFWSMDEHVFFHADPHPANILVGANNQLVFIDFGSCGSFNNHQRLAMEQLVLAMQRADVEGMALATLSLMEPLPPVDIPAMVAMAQRDYLRVLYTFNTPAKYTEYWERTSARQWVVLIQVARKFNLSLNLHMLRMIRATLLYDSIVLRLDHQLSRWEEYAHFMDDRAQMIKDRWRQQLRDNAGDTVFLRAEELSYSLNDLMLRAESTLGRPIVALGSSVDKWAFTLSVLSRLAGRIFLVTLIGLGLVTLLHAAAGQPTTLGEALLVIGLNPLYQIIVVLAGVLNLRHILFRLRERDATNNRTS